ncbi:Uncharacterised protein [Neisseria elongata]|uniref:Uncharacterized protein n=1 Tax=Neisseria elongata TaxID=495 RepID=A0A378TYY9_NEIEL|nr:hypothetical protein [Neisseria elongata]SFG67474.1 hypothetical protein SAMN05421815_10150 [Neisseria elongata subsp. elongata]STZ67143.1 Uncharacterised protein [Neisseria elongata]
MRLTKYPYNSIRELEDYLINTYQKYIILQEEGKEIYRCFILSFHKEFNIGIGLAVSCISIPPKVLIFDDENIFIGFDSVVFCISIQNLKVNMLNIDGIFFDIYLLENQKICIIHALGAIITDKNFTRENSVSTDIISDWKIDKINKLIILTELDSDKIISLNYD